MCNPDSLGHGMESGWCRLHCSPFCRARLLELWYRVLRSSSVPVTHEGYLVESRRSLSSLEQQWLHEPTCNVEILHRAQIGQDVYTEYVRTIYIYIYIKK